MGMNVFRGAKSALLILASDWKCSYVYSTKICKIPKAEHSSGSSCAFQSLYYYGHWCPHALVFIPRHQLNVGGGASNYFRSTGLSMRLRMSLCFQNGGDLTLVDSQRHTPQFYAKAGMLEDILSILTANGCVDDSSDASSIVDMNSTLSYQWMKTYQWKLISDWTVTNYSIIMY